nr:hypothetical protein CFP56_07445 [Quercus suber]
MSGLVGVAVLKCFPFDKSSTRLMYADISDCIITEAPTTDRIAKLSKLVWFHIRAPPPGNTVYMDAPRDGHCCVTTPVSRDANSPIAPTLRITALV